MSREPKLDEARRRIEKLERQLAAMEAAKNYVEHQLDAILASRAWRLTAPVRGVRQYLGLAARAARRHVFTFAIHPMHHVATEGAGVYRSLGDDPQLLLTPNDATRFPYGWVRFSAKFDPAVTFASEPTLFLDFGIGFEQGDFVALPQPVDGRVSGLFKIGRGCTAIRFDPGISEGTFCLSDITVTEMTATEAGTRLAARLVVNRRWRPRDLPRLARKALNVARVEGVQAVVDRVRGRDRRDLSGPLYDAWLRRHGEITPADRNAIALHIESFDYRPRFSIVMPVYNSHPKWLARAIDSVLDQLYGDWELCIADDASTLPETRKLLEAYSAKDARIKVVFREKNGHISAASNSALEVCTGDYVVLLDHDDEIAPHALYMCADALNANRDAVVLYSDEDKIDETGRRYDPYFKPSWNLDLFRSHNMVSHLGVYRRSAIADAGGFRLGYEGSQDYDLALRITEKLPPSQIVHIPHVLYHWRSLAGSTALDIGEKSYAVKAAKLSLEDHLRRLSITATVEPAWKDSPYHRVRYSVPQSKPRASILIATRDRVDLLSVAIESIEAITTYENYEIVIADNQSNDPATIRYLRELEKRGTARVIRYDQPFNFSAINNAAARASAGEVLVLLNNDVEIISPDWLDELVGLAMRPEVGCVGAMLYYPDERIQHAGVVLGVHGIAGHMHRLLKRGARGYFGRASVLQNFSAVTAACVAVRRAVFDEVGGLDEKLAVAFNDVDFCIRVRDAGYLNVWTPYAELYHYESASRGSDMEPSKRKRFESEIQFMIDRWGDALRTDPAYNPNLSLDDDQFVLASTSRAVRPWLEPHARKPSDKRKQSQAS